jgi:hypothetical protein
MRLELGPHVLAIVLLAVAGCGAKALSSGSDPTTGPATSGATIGVPDRSSSPPPEAHGSAHHSDVDHADADGGTFEGTEGGTTADEGGTTAAGLCCPIDPAPACCMKYGGWSGDPMQCATACDGMPWPSYAGWEKRIDSHGCEYWYTPPDAPAGCGPLLDGGSH